jgi:hypothetical protein
MTPVTVPWVQGAERKKGSITIDIATSPHKKNKSPIISVFKGLIYTLQAGSIEEAETLGAIYKKRMEYKKKEQEQEAHELLGENYVWMESWNTMACLKVLNKISTHDNEGWHISI